MNHHAWRGQAHICQGFTHRSRAKRFMEMQNLARLPRLVDEQVRSPLIGSAVNTDCTNPKSPSSPFRRSAGAGYANTQTTPLGERILRTPGAVHMPARSEVMAHPLDGPSIGSLPKGTSLLERRHALNCGAGKPSRRLQPASRRPSALARSIQSRCADGVALRTAVWS